MATDSTTEYPFDRTGTRLVSSARRVRFHPLVVTTLKHKTRRDLLTRYAYLTDDVTASQRNWSAVSDSSTMCMHDVSQFHSVMRLDPPSADHVDRMPTGMLGSMLYQVGTATIWPSQDMRRLLNAQLFRSVLATWHLATHGTS